MLWLPIGVFRFRISSWTLKNSPFWKKMQGCGAVTEANFSGTDRKLFRDQSIQVHTQFITKTSKRKKGGTWWVTYHGFYGGRMRERRRRPWATVRINPLQQSGHGDPIVVKQWLQQLLIALVLLVLQHILWPLIPQTLKNPKTLGNANLPANENTKPKDSNRRKKSHK